jgi:Modifier of rudimentary (Mod(r)) protein
MFSWTSNRRGPGAAGAAAGESSSAYGSAYPAAGTARVTTASTTTTTTTATPILGSIRPPDTASNISNGTTGISRQRHLESFLSDDTLKRSTRRVSSGKFCSSMFFYLRAHFAKRYHNSISPLCSLVAPLINPTFPVVAYTVCVCMFLFCIDDTTYDTVFSTVMGDTLILRIHLSPSPYPAAPVRAPAMTLAGVSARHPWLDRQMRVIGYPAIASDQAWKDSRLLLGTAAKEVIQHLQVSPPEIVQILDEALKVIQKAKPQPSSTTTDLRQPPQQQQQRRYSATPSTMDAPPDYETFVNDVPSMEMPSIPMYFDELDDRDLPQLNQLISDETLFLQFCKSLSVTKTIQKINTSVIVDNADMARQNLQKRHDLQLLYGEVVELQQKVKQKVASFQELERQQDALCAPPDPMIVMRLLAKAKKEAFDESERIAEDWLETSTAITTTPPAADGSSSTTINQSSGVDAFVKSFMEKRKVHHLRAAKMEVLRRQGSKSI